MTKEDLQLLQRRCRADPASYAAEYETALCHYEALLTSVTLSPSAPAEGLEELLSFMAAVCPGYPDSIPRVVPPLVVLLTEAGPVLSAPLRRAAVRSLALLRAKGVANGESILPLFFRLLECADKPLRAALHGHIVADIKRSARGGMPARSSQAFLFGMVADPSEVLVKRSLHVLCDLYSRGVWADARTANVVAGALFHRSPTPAIVAARFLLGTWRRVVPGADGGTGGLDEEEAEAAAAAPVGADGSGFGGDADPPLAALYDPQEVAERLFADIRGRRKRESFDTRLLLLNLLTRMVGFHRLLLLGLYPYLQRYLQPHQESVPAMLACLVQGVHERVPPEELHPIIRALADNFVCDRSSVEAIATGLNAIRAVCARAPLAIMDPVDEAAMEEAVEEEAFAGGATAAVTEPADGGADGGAGSAAVAVSSTAAERQRLHAQLEASTGGAGRGRKAAARAARRRRARAIAAGEVPSDDDGDDAASVATAATAGAGTEATSALLADLIQYRNHRDKGVTAAARGLVVLYRRVYPGLLDRRMRGKEVSTALAAGAVLAVPVYGQAPPSRSDGLAADAPAAAKRSDGKATGAVEGSDSSDGEAGSASSGASGSVGDSDSDSDSGSDSDNDGDVGGGGNDGDAGGGGSSNGASAALATRDLVVGTAAGSAGRGSDSDSDADSDGMAIDEVGAAVSASDLASAQRRQRKTLEEKLEAVRAGRVGRPRYGSSRGLTKGGGSTNADKRKTKAASMVLHKQRAKGRGSFRDKQIGKGRKIGNKQKRVFTRKY
ncbi:hypothetical protein MMPV_005916 [Pyropia vietnamensis]